VAKRRTLATAVASGVLRRITVERLTDDGEMFFESKRSEIPLGYVEILFDGSSRVLEQEGKTQRLQATSLGLNYFAESTSPIPRALAILPIDDVVHDQTRTEWNKWGYEFSRTPDQNGVSVKTQDNAVIAGLAALLDLRACITNPPA
jgi:hypothetical protein